MATLGLTSKVVAQKLNDIEIELLVSNLPGKCEQPATPETRFFQQYLRQNKKIPFVGWAPVKRNPTNTSGSTEVRTTYKKMAKVLSKKPGFLISGLGIRGICRGNSIRAVSVDKKHKCFCPNAMPVAPTFNLMFFGVVGGRTKMVSNQTSSPTRNRVFPKNPVSQNPLSQKPGFFDNTFAKIISRTHQTHHSGRRTEAKVLIKKPGFLPTGFLVSAKTDIRSTRTPKKPGFSQKPGFCWGQKRVGEAQAACNIAQKMAKVLFKKPGFLISECALPPWWCGFFRAIAYPCTCS